MIQGKRILAIIPARAGSKRIPRKNLVDLGGKKLIEWSYKSAKESKYIDKILVSSDCPEVLDLATKYGLDTIKRPEKLADDFAKSSDVVLHALSSIKDSFDFFILLQPTSPFRTAEDIDNGLEYAFKQAVKRCVAVRKSIELPYFMFFKDDINGKLKPILGNPEGLRSQDFTSVYVMNGAFYIVEIEEFLKSEVFIDDDTIGYVMSTDHSIDIDDYKDLDMAKERVK